MTDDLQDDRTTGNKPAFERDLDLPSGSLHTINLQEAELAQRIIEGDARALAGLFSLHYKRLWRIVNFRIDPRLRSRIDPDDVIQESYLNAQARIRYFFQEASHSCLIWLRLIVQQTLIDIQRRHLGVKKRDASKDISINSPRNDVDTSACLSFMLCGSGTTPSQVAMRGEIRHQIEQAINSLSELDREVLALRHFEELSNAETAHVLKISPQAASVRYIRALNRLKTIIRPPE